MSNINNLIKELHGLIMSTTSSQDFISYSRDKSSEACINVSFRLGILDMLENPKENNSLHYRFDGTEPLIDVVKTKDTIRVIAILPGIKKEDVQVNVKKDILEVEITKNGQVYRKEIPCNAKTEQISVKSTTLNNSVLEIVFIKK